NPEKHPHDDSQRQPHHLLMHVANLALTPLGDRLLRVVRHNARVRSNAVAMECRLRKPPLAQPGLTYVGQQTLAKEPPALADHVVFQKILIIADQYRLDQVGMIQKENIDPNGAVIKNVAKLTRPSREDSQRIMAGQRHIAENKMRLRPRRAGIRGSTHNLRSLSS